MFEDAPKALIDTVEQVVRLIRSKGVGIYFVTQNPLDIAEDVLGQLANRVQHALRAYTPRDQRAVRAAAETFRPNPALDTERTILELGVGEALVSFLDGDGVPGMVEKTLIRPPSSRIGPASDDERATVRSASPVATRYDEAIDRESAHEVLKKRADARLSRGPWGDVDARQTPQRQTPERRAPRRQSRRQTVGEAMAKSAARSIGSALGRQIVRGILGAILKK